MQRGRKKDATGDILPSQRWGCGKASAAPSCRKRAYYTRRIMEAGFGNTFLA
jgi:hypothetical protein